MKGPNGFERRRSDGVEEDIDADGGSGKRAGSRRSIEADIWAEEELCQGYDRVARLGMASR